MKPALLVRSLRHLAGGWLPLLVFWLPLHSLAEPEDSVARGSGSSLSLARAVTLALENGFAARIARLEAGRAGDVANRTRGQYLPQLGVDSQVGWASRMDEFLLDANGKRYGLDNLGNEPWLDIYLDQVLLDLALLRRMARDRLAEQVAAIAEQEVREAAAYEVTRQYADLVRLESLAASAALHVEQAAWLDRETQHLSDSGRLLAVDREEAEIHLADAQQRSRAIRAERISARALLRKSLGAERAAADWPAVEPASLPDPTRTTRLSSDELDAALRRAPQLRMLELRTQMEQASVSAAKAERFPTLRMRGGYSHYGINRFDNFEDEAYVFVGMHLPLFDGLQAKSAISGARKAVEVASLKYRSLLGDQRARVERVAQRIAGTHQELALADRRTEISRVRQRLADRDLQARRGSVAAALSARQRTLESVERGIQLRYRRLELWASLQRELGQLVEQVERVAAVAQPTELTRSSGP